MGITDFITKSKFPDSQKIADDLKNIKQVVEKTNMNTIKVIYFNSDFNSFVITYGRITRKTSIPLVLIDIPDSLAVLMVDDSVYIDSRTNEKYIIVVENYPYSIVLNSEIEYDITQEIQEEYKLTTPVCLGLKNYPEIRTKKVKFGLNSYPVELKDDEQDSNLINEHRFYSITQAFLRQIGDYKILESTNENRNEGLIWVIAASIPIGGILGFILAIYLMG